MPWSHRYLWGGVMEERHASNLEALWEEKRRRSVFSTQTSAPTSEDPKRLTNASRDDIWPESLHSRRTEEAASRKGSEVLSSLLNNKHNAKVIA